MYRRDIRPEIVDSFIEEWNIRGSKLTLDAVASRMHISKKTIYRFFDSKDEIYRYILSDACKTIELEQARIYKDENLSTKEKLVAVLGIKTNYEEKIHLERASSLSVDSPKVYAEIMKAYESRWGVVEAILEKAKAENVIRENVNIPLTIAFLRKGMTALYEGDTLASSKLSYGEAIATLSEVVLGGILA